MHTYTRHILIGALLGATTAIGMIIVSSVSAVPGEIGMLPNLYYHGILENPTQVKNATKLDGLQVDQIQKRIPNTCPAGQWAYGVNTDNTLKCR